MSTAEKIEMKMSEEFDLGAQGDLCFINGLIGTVDGGNIMKLFEVKDHEISLK